MIRTARIPIALIPVVLSLLLPTGGAQAAIRHHISDPERLGNPGGGVYLFNQPGFYYMGRLYDGQTFDRHSTRGARDATYRSQNGVFRSSAGLLYRWGYAVGNVGVCLWVGPSAGAEPGVGYLGPSEGHVGNRCDPSTVDWLTERAHIGRDFNCPPHQARGPQWTTLTERANLYANLEWADDYSGGPAVDKRTATPLPAGTRLQYRYTTRDGNKAVVFVPGQDYGWGFVLADKIQKVSGKWSFAGDGAQYDCGENLKR